MNSHFKTHISRYMGIILLLLLILPSMSVSDSMFKKVLPGYKYSFPRDHFSHPGFQTEWWYYTGNLQTKDGKAFGFELTFFRRGIETQRKRQSDSSWVMRDIYFAHLAISDRNRGKFYFWEKMNRKGPGLAGAEEESLLVWNGRWRLEGKNGMMYLQAHELDFGIDLKLMPLKPPVIHGEEGISKKSQEQGYASHYYSLTRIDTQGKISISGDQFEVTGLSWMDHEFFSHQIHKKQEGWDWFSIQLETGMEIMLYQMRLRGGGIDPVSSGTIIEKNGTARHLKSSAFSIEVSDTWKSKKTDIVYPSGWHIEIPGHAIKLEIRPAFKDQELLTNMATYWEGSCIVTGTYKGKDVSGSGYTELAGYAGKTF